MKKVWILIVITAVLTSLSACSRKIDEVPPQPKNQEVSKNSTVKPNENEQIDKEEKIEEKVAEEKAFKIPAFTSVDLDGNEVTDSFFANNKITVLNIWTTT